MPPWQGGGNMIADVTFEETVTRRRPTRFEAGTGNIADAVGLGAALDYVDRHRHAETSPRYEHELLEYATDALGRVPGLRLIGTARREGRRAVVRARRLRRRARSARRSTSEGIAVRAGHHCAQPILRRFGLEATVRPSLAFYNTCEEIDLLVDAVRDIATSSHRIRA